MAVAVPLELRSHAPAETGLADAAQRAFPSNPDVHHTALPWIVDADASSFDDAINASMLVLVDVWAPWCGPCRMVSPVVEKVGYEYAGRLRVVKLDIDRAPAIASRFGVQGIPLLLLVRDGREVDRLVGAVPPATLRAALEQHLGAASPGG